jgi:hypothetical protein
VLLKNALIEVKGKRMAASEATGLFSTRAIHFMNVEHAVAVAIVASHVKREHGAGSGGRGGETTVPPVRRILSRSAYKVRRTWPAQTKRYAQRAESEQFSSLVVLLWQVAALK